MRFHFGGDHISGKYKAQTRGSQVEHPVAMSHFRANCKLSQLSQFQNLLLTRGSQDGLLHYDL